MSTTVRRMLLAGPLSVVLLVAGAAAFPSPPGGDVAPGRDRTWLHAHTGAVLAQAYVRSLAALAFVVLVVAVARIVRRHEPLVVAGGALYAAAALGSQALAAGSALFVRGGGAPDAAAALGRAQEALLDVSALPLVLVFGAVGAAALADRSLPRWLGWLGLVGVPLALLDAASYDGGPLAEVGVLGLVYVLVWALATSVGLMRIPAAVPRPA